MRIGLLAPITWRTPPRRYGPWEQVVYNLATGLTNRGHEVTVFATADSQVPGRLVAVCPRPLGEDPRLDPKVWETLHMGMALATVRDLRLDVLHNHLNCYPLPFSPLLPVPMVTTLHGAALLEPATREIYRRFRHLPFVSISNAERAGLPELHYVATVYNGIDLRPFTFQPRHGTYLAFLGRISAKKGAHHAVAIARQSGMPLMMAGPIPDDEKEFFARELRPQIDGVQIRFLGEVGPPERDRLLGGALALLHPVTVPEPFGLVLAEAGACGTPVIGFGLGSVPEVVEDGVTGFVVSSVEEAVEAVKRVPQLRREDCRRRVEEHFTLDRMVEGYLAVYERVVAAAAS